MLIESGWRTEVSEMVIPERQRHEDVATSPRAERGAIGSDARAVGEAWEAAEGWFAG
jgi:hypothetical protein